MAALEAAVQATAVQLVAGEAAVAAAFELVAQAVTLQVSVTAAESCFGTVSCGLSYVLTPLRCAFAAHRLNQLREVYEARKREQEKKAQQKREMDRYNQEMREYFARIEKYFQAITRVKKTSDLADLMERTDIELKQTDVSVSYICREL